MGRNSGIVNSRVEITSEYKHKNMARAVPGSRWEPTAGPIVKKYDGTKRPKGAWVVDSPTPRSAAVILRLFPECGDKHPELHTLRETLIKDARPFDNATPYNKRIDAGDCLAALQEEGHDWYNYQALDLGYLRDVMALHKGAYIGWERGMGKTLAGCALTESLGAKRVLVVCPNTAKETVWLPEVERFLDHSNVRVLPNPKPQRERLLAKVKAMKHLVLVVHYESLALIAKQRKDWRGWDEYGEWDLVIMDEAHRLANPKTQMHRAANKLPTKYKLALSGSVIQNHPEEIYGVLNWLFPKNYTSKWRDWNDRFLDYVKSGYGKVLVGPKLSQVEKLQHELGTFAVYRRREDELDLPPKTEQTLYVKISEKQRAAYDELKDSFIATLDSGEQIAALSPVVLLTRLRQVATGLSLVADEVTDSSKLDLALDLIRDAGDDAFVVFSWYKAAALTLAERLDAEGIVNHVVTGDIPHRRRAEKIKAFQEGQGRVFIGTISTLGESVNLHRASQAVFLDRSWNPAANAQAEDRLHRIGQDKPVHITHLVAKDTVDELRVLPALNEKDQLRRLILGGK